MEERLRDFLQDLLKGNKSPLRLEINHKIAKYIKEHSNDLGIRYLVELELDEDIELYSENLIMPESRIAGYKENYSGRYKIIFNKKTKCEYETYLKEKILFITEKEDKKYFNKVTNEDIHIDLYYNVLRDLKLSEYDIHSCREAIYDQTYKLDILTFRKVLSELSPEEIRLEYYKYYIPAKFEKLRYELEKYFDKDQTQKHIAIIDFFKGKFLMVGRQQQDSNIRKCYELISDELVKLKKHMEEYFGIQPPEPVYPDKLVLNGDYLAFKDFFVPLVDKKDIKYAGTDNKYAIYKFLLEKIQIGNEGREITIEQIMKDLNIKSLYPSEQIERLDFYGGYEYFGSKFGPKIDIINPEKGLFMILGKMTWDLMANRLCEIFTVYTKRNPNRRHKVSVIRVGLMKKRKSNKQTEDPDNQFQNTTA